MLTITQVHYIRKLYYEKGKNYAEIARATGHNHRTIKKYIEKTDFRETPRKVKRTNRSDYLRSHIRECLQAYQELKKKHRLHKAESIHRYLVEEKGIEVTISKRRFRTLVAEERAALQEDGEVYLDLEHPGGEAQLDFGEIILENQGEMVKKHELVLSFPASNGGYVQITESEQSEALFEAMTAIFHHLGRVPRKIWFDRMSTAALRKKDEEGHVRMSERLTRFATHHGFEAVFCNPASGHEKGSVENKVGYYRRNFINLRREGQDLDAMNKALLSACDKDHEREHYRKKKRIATLLEEEKGLMNPLNPIPLDMNRWEKRRVDKYGHICFEGNSYSVHPRFVKNWVNLRVGARELVILDKEHEEIVRHRRDYKKGRTFTHWQDFMDTICQRPRALKYSAIYRLFPQNWQDYLENASKEETKASLAFLKHCLLHHDLHTAEEVLAENTKEGGRNSEALWTTLYRRQEERALYESTSSPENPPRMPAYETDLGHYDVLMARANHES